MSSERERESRWMNEVTDNYDCHLLSQKGLLFLPFNLPGDGDLVEIEDEPGQVAHDEHEHYEHQHHGLPVLPPPPPPSHDRDADPGVDEDDGREGEQPQQ